LGDPSVFYQLKEKYDKKIFVQNDFSLILVSIFVKPIIDCLIKNKHTMNQLNQYAHQNFQESLEIVRSSERANVLNMLTLEEKTIIYEYTDWEYLTVNSSLRESKGTIVSEFAQYLDTVLSKLPNYVGVVHRGAELSKPQFHVFQHSFLNKIPVIEYGFLSTSQEQIVATNFTGDFLFEIFSKTGKIIEDIAKNGTYSYESEQEVLFRKNTHFKVLDIIEKSKSVLIILNEI
jgi:ADP-ribosyltransferase exoenzyme